MFGLKIHINCRILRNLILWISTQFPSAFCGNADNLCSNWGSCEWREQTTTRYNMLQFRWIHEQGRRLTPPASTLKAFLNLADEYANPFGIDRVFLRFFDSSLIQTRLRALFDLFFPFVMKFPKTHVSRPEIIPGLRAKLTHHRRHTCSGTTDEMHFES